MKEVEHRTSPDISMEESIWLKLQLKVIENGWLDPVNEKHSSEFYISNDGLHFSVIYIKDSQNKVSSINVSIDSKASLGDIERFADIVFRPEVIMKSSLSFLIFLSFQEQFLHRLSQKFNFATSGLYRSDDFADTYLAPSDMFLEKLNLPEGYRYGTLDEKHVAFVAEKWYKSMEPVTDAECGSRFDYFAMTKQNIVYRPTVAIYHETNTMPITWMLVYNDGFAGMLHVREAYRRKGFGRCTLLKMFSVMKAINGNGPPVSIVRTNLIAEKLFQTEGWVKQSGSCKLFPRKVNL